MGDLGLHAQQLLNNLKSNIFIFCFYLPLVSSWDSLKSHSLNWDLKIFKNILKSLSRISFLKAIISIWQEDDLAYDFGYLDVFAATQFRWSYVENKIKNPVMHSGKWEDTSLLLDVPNDEK